MTLAIVLRCLAGLTVAGLTTAGLTTAGLVAPLLIQTYPDLLVLAVGAGSLLFWHVNDTGFWLFKEYVNLSSMNTLRSWSVREAFVSVTGLAGVLLLNQLLHS